MNFWRLATKLSQSGAVPARSADKSGNQRCSKHAFSPASYLFGFNLCRVVQDGLGLSFIVMHPAGDIHDFAGQRFHIRKFAGVIFEDDAGKGLVRERPPMSMNVTPERESVWTALTVPSTVTVSPTCFGASAAATIVCAWADAAARASPRAKTAPHGPSPQRRRS